METRLKVSGGSEPLKKAIGAAKRQSRYQDILILIACMAQGNHHEIRIAFFKRDKLVCQSRLQVVFVFFKYIISSE